jgi:molecular chaperone DnaK
VPQIEVTFDIDANGILHVSAKDLGTSKEQKITITASSGLNDQEIKKMVSDAEQHAEDDQKRRELAEAHNVAENAAYQAEKLIAEQGEKIDAEKKSKVEAAIAALRASLKAGDIADLKAKQEALNHEMQAVSADLYAKAKSSQGPKAGHEPQDGAGAAAQDKGGAAPKDQGDVIDADFEMVDDDKNKK